MPRSAATPADPGNRQDGRAVTSKGGRGLKRPRQKALFGSGDAPGWDPADTSGGSYGSRGFGASGHGSRGDAAGSAQGGFTPDAPPPPTPDED